MIKDEDVATVRAAVAVATYALIEEHKAVGQLFREIRDHGKSTEGSSQRLGDAHAAAVRLLRGFEGNDLFERIRKDRRNG